MDTVTRFVSVLKPGSSFLARAETSAGDDVVVKFQAGGLGPRALVGEMVAASIADLFAIRVPSCRPVHLPADLPWHIGTDEFDQTVQMSAGPNLAIDFLEGASDLTAADLEGLSSAFQSHLAAFDAVLGNVDRTKQNPNLMRDREGQIWAIDHGGCLHIERLLRGEVSPSPLFRDHFLAHRPAASFVSPALEAIVQRIAHVRPMLPETWLADLNV